MDLLLPILLRLLGYLLLYSTFVRLLYAFSVASFHDLKYVTDISSRTSNSPKPASLETDILVGLASPQAPDHKINLTDDPAV